MKPAFPIKHITTSTSIQFLISQSQSQEICYIFSEMKNIFVWIAGLGFVRSGELELNLMYF